MHRALNSFFFLRKDSCKVNSRTILEDIKSIQKLLLPLWRRSNIFEFFSEKLLIPVLLDSFQRFVRWGCYFAYWPLGAVRCFVQSKPCWTWIGFTFNPWGKGKVRWNPNFHPRWIQLCWPEWYVATGTYWKRGSPITSYLSGIQLAKLSGFSPIITTASLKHTEYLKSIGATHVIDRSISASNLADKINGITQNVPVKYALDSISLPDTQQTVFNLLGKGGKLAVFLPPAVKNTEDKEVFYIFGVLRGPANIELLESLYHDNLEQLLKEGAIKVSRGCKNLPVYLLTNWITAAKQSRGSS